MLLSGKLNSSISTTFEEPESKTGNFSQSRSLEDMYGDLATQDHEWEISRFDDYREPNEGYPERIRPHLEAAWNREGIAVSTGTERSFFHLLFSNHDLCHGMVIRDINPQIIAYAHFNILLLRIAQSVEDYARFAFSKSLETLNEIKERTSFSQMPDQFRQFYLRNFDHLAEAYRTTSFRWRSDVGRSTKKYFQEVQYYKNDEQFKVLQAYARSGNIVPILGDINDLRNFGEIVVIDTSNIFNYSILDPEYANISDSPTVIWTNPIINNPSFKSIKHTPLSRDEHEEMDELIEVLMESSGQSTELRAELMYSRLMHHNQGRVTFIGYSKETLKLLQEVVETYCVHFPEIGWIDFGGYADATRLFMNKIQNLSLSQLDDICQTPGIEKHVKMILRNSSALNPTIRGRLFQIERNWAVSELRAGP